MNEKQIKIKILIIQTLDWSLIISIVVGIYIAIENETEAFYIAIMGLVGLGIVHQIGYWSINKIHTLRTNLHNLEQEKKRGEISELLSKGGQKAKKS